jgi:hypothetical protein
MYTIFWYAEPLLGGDREIDDCTTNSNKRNGVFNAVRAEVF